MSKQFKAGSPSEYANILKKDGVVVIEDFLDEETCDEINEEISKKLENDELPVYESTKSYSELTNAGEPVVNKRIKEAGSGPWDDGMLDIFNMELVIPVLVEIRDDKFTLDIISEATGTEYSGNNVNVYINESVTETHPLHADSYGGQFKSFIYLVDVPDESHGPFAYVKGTHRPSRLTRVTRSVRNRVKGTPKKDAVKFNEADAVKFTAPKGTLIIADQTGLHRGIPQKEGKRRVLVTTSYTPKGK